MQNKKWLSILLAFAVSIGLWLYVVTIENPSKDLTISNVPVTFTNLDVLRENGFLIVDSNVSAGVDLKFVGRLSDLNKLKQNESEIGVVVDVSRFMRAQDYKISYGLTNVVLPSSVSSRDLSLELQSPYDIRITTAKLASKKIEVVFDAQIEPKEGFTVGVKTQNYQEINVEGPEEIVEQIAYAKAVLQRENVDTTINTELDLSIIDKNGRIVNIDASSLSVSTRTIEVEVPVRMLKTVDLEAVIDYGDSVSENDVSVKIEPSEITLAADASVLENIQKVQLPKIDLSKIMTNDATLTMKITPPDGCENASSFTETEVNVKISNKSIRNMVIPSSNFYASNLPADMKINYSTRELPITIRANSQDIDRISVNNVRVEIDLSQDGVVTETSRTLPVRIVIDGFEGAGAITDQEQGYTVTFNIVAVK